MAAVNYQRHTAALRALLGVETDAPEDDPAPGYDGPAVWIGPSAPEPLANAAAAAWRNADGDYDPAISALASDVVAGKGPRASSVSMQGPNGDLRAFELTGVPQGGGVLVLGRETTVQTRAWQGLRSARDMFRDIALCVGGFAFETDAMGLLRWVGPGKPLGFAPETLIGHPAIDLLQIQSPDALNPFAARDPVDDLPLWANSFDQGPRALRMTVRPIFDGTGAWRGVRGHARDETIEIRQTRRDRFCQDIVQAMRAAQGPAALLRAVAAATAQACGTASAWVFCSAPDMDCAVSHSDAPCETMRQIAARTIQDGVQFPSLFASNERTGLALALRAQDQTQGALLIAAGPGTEGLTRDAQEMLRLIAPMAAVALAQVRLSARMQSHASQDALTGLLNQTGWHEALDVKLKAHKTGAVVLVECDRFRAFGDGLGQAASDELLVEIAGRLSALCGPMDRCARLAEALFAVWLEDATGPEADAKADDIAEAFRIASRRMSLALAATPVIGVAHAGDDHKTLASPEELMARAAQALATAKRRMRGRGAAQTCSKT